MSRRDVAASSIVHHNPYDFNTEGKQDLQETIGGAVNEVHHSSPEDEKGHEAAKNAALRLLSMRSHSRKELKQRLIEKGYALEAARRALDRLQEVGLQSDREFAEVFARSKWRQSKWSAGKISSELARRGVACELVDEAIESVFGPEALNIMQHCELMEDEADDATTRAEDALLQTVRRMDDVMRDLTPEARKRRLVGWLQRRGHSWANIRHLLEQLDKEAAVRNVDDGWS